MTQIFQRAGASAATTAAANAQTTEGTEGDDFLIGTSSDEVIRGLGGNDRLEGRGGDDLLEGGTGDDTLVGGDLGSDTMVGGAGDDFYVRDSAGDTVTELADEGIDHVLTSVSFSLPRHVENASVFVPWWSAPQDVWLVGHAGANSLFGGEGDDTIHGQGGDDSLGGGGGRDKVHGGDGADSLYGANPSNGDRPSFSAELYGGLGNDNYSIYTDKDLVVEAAGEGIDVVYSEIDFTLPDHVEHLLLFSAVKGSGNSESNSIVAVFETDNVLAGLGGDDRLEGRAGDDLILGGTGLDTARYSSASAGVTARLDVDRWQDTGAAGRDRLKGIENLEGSAFADRLVGNGGANLLDGLGGEDVMIGGGRNDRYRVDSAGDRAVERAGGGGNDVVESSVSYRLANHLEGLVLYGDAVIGNGNALANTITGNAGSNLLRGRAGNDAIFGGEGGDGICGGLGNDRLTGGSGADRFLFDEALGDNADSLLDFASGEDSIRLDGAIFEAIETGRLDAAAFRDGGNARDADDRILYHPGSGRIFYDADGSGEAAAILFARVEAGSELSHSDFIVY